MTRFAQIVMGPAGTGKSTYCNFVEKHAQVTQRNIRVVNLDPAAEHFNYTPVVDIRDLVNVADAMESDDELGPNGALVYCFKEFIKNMDEWLLPQLGADLDGDYYIFDCPGQIELYTHMDLMKNFVAQLEKWNFRVCAVFTIDAHFLTDGCKFIAGSLTALSTMINLAVPHVNLLTKMDLLSKKDRKRLDSFLEPDTQVLLDSMPETSWTDKYIRLTEAIGRVLEDFSLVKFFPLNIKKVSQLENLFLMIDIVMGVSEDAEVKPKDFEDIEEGDEDD